MKRTISSNAFPLFHSLSILCISLLIFSSGTAAAATYYVRPNGGDNLQCNGLSNTDYPGSGTNASCAFNSISWLLPPGRSAILKSGDTAVIGKGSYKIGYGAPNTIGKTSVCSSSWTYDCNMPAIPSGTAGKPTRILGEGWDTGCSSPPELWGTERVSYILSLKGSSNVEVQCLDITDHSSCIEFHSGSLTCVRDTYPHGDWASQGITAADSSNVFLKNLNIHGFAHSGVYAGRLRNWSSENVRIAANGWVGWDGDISGDDSNEGTMYFKNLTIEWNGCGETYPGRQPTGCWAQSAGGYGDGLGTGATNGTWIFEDSNFLHSTSDGLDLLYHRSNEPIILRRVRAEGNAGNQIKTSGTTYMENSVIVGNCGFFQGKSFTYNVDNCRAGGNAFGTSFRKGTAVALINNVIYSAGDCLMLAGNGGCNGSEKFISRNNILRGDTDFLQADWGDISCLFYNDGCTGLTLDNDYSVIYNVKSGYGSCPMGSHDSCSDPLLTGPLSGENYGMIPQQSSPAINKGLAAGTVVTTLAGIGTVIIPAADYKGTARPQGSGTDIGAYELGSGSPPADTTSPLRNNPSPSGILSAGTKTATLSLQTNEAATCKYSVSAGTSYNSMASSFTTANGLSHTSSVSGLQNGTNYTYYVRCRDTAGNMNPDDSPIVFGVASSPSPPADTNPPIRSNPAPAGILAAGTTTATLSLQTNEDAACRYALTANTAYTVMANLLQTSDKRYHAAIVSGLQNEKSYSYYLRCQDAAGNANTNDTLISFSVAASAPQNSSTTDKEYATGEIPVVLYNKPTPGEGKINISIDVNPSTAASAELLLKVFDPDNPQEGYIYINGNPGIELPNKWEYDAQAINLTLSLNRSWLVQGNNTIRFTHVSTLGYEVRAASIKLYNVSIQTNPSCIDSDADKFNASQSECGIADCNDANAAVNPGQAEICSNGIDDDCDGTDTACPQPSNVSNASQPSQPGNPAENGGSSGGGEGGGGGTSPSSVKGSKIYNLGEIAESKIETRDVNKDDKIKVKIYDIEHTLTVVSALPEAVQIEINSRKTGLSSLTIFAILGMFLGQSSIQTITIQKGETQTLDIDGDSILELAITYLGLSDGQASLQIVRIHEPIPAAAQETTGQDEKVCGDWKCAGDETSATCCSDCGCGVGQECREGGCIVTQEKVKNHVQMLVIGSLAVLLIISAFIIWLYLKSHENDWVS